MAYGKLGCPGARVATPMWESPPSTVYEDPLWPQYLAACSLGNSRRLVASSSVRNTGMMRTFGGSAAPRITKQQGQGLDLGWGRWRGSHSSWGRRIQPTRQLREQRSDTLLSPEEKTQNRSDSFRAQQGRSPHRQFYSSWQRKVTFGGKKI